MKAISRLLVIVGILLIVTPIVGRVYTHYKQQQLYAAYIEEIKEKDETEIKPKVKPNIKVDRNESVLAEAVEEVAPLQDLEINKGDVIGKIKIDKIDVDLILLEGVSDKELGLGVGHIIESAQPGRLGNCAIAGHRNYTFGSMFNRLGEVEVGDEVELEFMGEKYRYTVQDINIVEPSDISVLEQDEKQRLLTLITCHPIYTGTHRLIITASLK